MNCLRLTEEFAQLPLISVAQARLPLLQMLEMLPFHAMPILNFDPFHQYYLFTEFLSMRFFSFSQKEAIKCGTKGCKTPKIHLNFISIED